MATLSRKRRAAPCRRPVRNTSAPPSDTAALGLDVGMTATRACVAPFSLRGMVKPHPHTVPRPKIDHDRVQFGDCDMPSAANFFAVHKAPKTCIGYIGDGPDQTPVKMYPYIIRMKMKRDRGSAEDDAYVRVHRQTIPQLDRFFHRFDEIDDDSQRRVLAHAQAIFLAHLRQVRSESEDVAASNGVEITQLAATIPLNWDQWMQRFYVLLLARAWDNLGSDSITLVHESEAIGHWLLRLDEKTRKSKPTRLIMADFGGHTLNYNVFHINYRANNNAEFAFFTLRDENCIHGGSELHASFVKERIRNDIASGKIAIEPEDQSHLYKTLMNDYRLQARSKIDGKPFHIVGQNSKERGARSIEVYFDQQQASKLYKICFGRPLAELNSLIKKTGKSKIRTEVMLSGGSFSNTHIWKQTQKEIKDAELKYLPWTEAVAFEGQKSCTVAVGASLSLVYAMSVEDFMKQAAFAVMVVPAKGKEPATAPVIWNGSGSRKATVNLSGRQGADVFIACCPLAPHGDAEFVPGESTFQFQSLSKNLRGQYSISLDYKEADDQEGQPDLLILTVASNDLNRAAHKEIVEWPIYYDPGACVCFIDIDKFEGRRGGGHNLDLAPGHFRNRKGANAYLYWEERRRDPGRLYWEDPKVPMLPLPSLEDFEIDEPARLDEDAFAPEIVDLSSDPDSDDSLEVTASPSRSKRARTGCPPRGRTRGGRARHVSQRNDTKRGARASRKKLNRSQKKSSEAGSGNFTYQRESTIIGSDSESEHMDSQFAPVETTDDETEIRKTPTSKYSASKNSDNGASTTTVSTPDSLHPRSAAYRTAIYPDTGNTAPTGKASRGWRNINTISTDQAHLASGSTQPYQHRAPTMMESATQNDVAPSSSSDEDALESAENNLQRLRESTSEQIPAGMSIRDIRLAAPMRPNAVPWAESLIRRFK